MYAPSGPYILGVMTLGHDRMAEALVEPKNAHPKSDQLFEDMKGEAEEHLRMQKAGLETLNVFTGTTYRGENVGIWNFTRKRGE